MLTDTHCHIHESDYPLGAEQAYQRALAAGVDRMVCVGTDLDSSQRALAFAAQHDRAWAAIGLHPHEATRSGIDFEAPSQLAVDRPAKLVAVGECGLDYFYHDDPADRRRQQQLLRRHLSLAAEYNLPVIFHVREAFADFWPIYEDFKAVRGVLHSFTDSQAELERALGHGLLIGVNGISTFTKDPAQQAMFATIPLENLLLETDAPYLTPKPIRGTVNEPAYVKHVARFHAALRGITEETVAAATTHNATQVFQL